MNIAFVTMVWRDYWLLERWIAHNARIVPKSSLYVINHGNDPEISRRAVGCNVIAVPRDDLPLDLTRRRWDLLGGLTNGLLAFYDCVVCTDVDEFLICAQDVSLPDYLAHVAGGDEAISPVGLNLIPRPEDVGDGAILERHPNAMLSAKYTKPCIVRAPVKYTVGGHGLRGGAGFRVDPNILLCHLHYVTPDYAERMAARQEIVSESKSQNAALQDPIDLPKRYWINWSDPAYIREKELGLFERAEDLDVTSGFDAAAEILSGAIVRNGRKVVVEPEIVNKTPKRITLPVGLRSAIEDRLPPQP